jgi:Tfp pilus assembly protein FimT
MKIRKSSKGFTLVEMLLYVSLCAVFLLALSNLLSFLLESRIRSQTVSEVNQQGFQIMTLITGTIRNGRSVQTPVMGATSSSLSVTVTNSLNSPTVFDVSSGTLRITEGSNSPIPLTNGRVTVSSPVFQNVSSASSTEKIVKISFTISSVNQSGKNEYSFSRVFDGSATLR